MNVTITMNGYLKVCAETELEAYALQKWAEHNMPSDVKAEELPFLEISWGLHKTGRGDD